MKITKNIIIILLSLILLSACAKRMQSNVYSGSASSMVGKVLEGTILSARKVVVNNADSVAGNSEGVVAGAVAGGLLGSTLGKGKGSDAAALGGALLGAIGGAYAQDSLMSQEAMEYVVRVDSKYINQIPTNSNNTSISHSYNQKSDIYGDIKSSTSVSETQTSLISVVQGMDVILHPGQRTLIIYNNNRPRLAPLY